MTEELPAGWAVEPLRRLTERLVDGSHNPPARTAEGLPMLSAQNIRGGGLSFTDARMIGAEDFEREDRRTSVSPGDVLLSIVGSIGRSTVVRVGLPRFTLQRSVAVVSPRGVDPKFLHYQFSSPGAQRYFETNARGTAQKGIYLGALGELPVRLAPLAEQQRIVSRIEELFSEIDEGERALERVGRLVERYRQSVLKAAVTGELTREWRGGAPVDGGDLVEAEDGKLPPGWNWQSLEELSWATSYGTSAKCAAERAGLPVLRIPNVRGGRIDLLDLKWAPDDLELATDDLLSPGDLLVVRTNGSDSLIGVGAVVLEPLPEPSYFASYLIRFRLKPEPHLAEWINLVWQSDVVRRFVHEHKATSAGQYNISQSKLRALRLPIPPEPERKHLLDAWQTVSSRVAATLRDVVAGRQGATALRQSILKAAFSGQLVPQDPCDEPASALLARLAAQSAGAPTAPTRRGRPPRQPATAL